MGVFDDLGDFARNVSNKAVGAANLGKISVNIKLEQSKIEEIQRQIGAYYYERHLNGLPVDSDIEMYIEQIDAINENIAALESEKRSVKGEYNFDGEGVRYCPNCGVKLAPGSNFCTNCGRSVN